MNAPSLADREYRPTQSPVLGTSLVICAWIDAPGATEVLLTVMVALPGAQLLSAALTFKRPPETILPDMPATGSTVLSSAAFKLGVFNVQDDKTSAAAPATNGAAID